MPSYHIVGLTLSGSVVAVANTAEQRRQQRRGQGKRQRDVDQFSKVTKAEGGHVSDDDGEVTYGCVPFVHSTTDSFYRISVALLALGVKKTTRPFPGRGLGGGGGGFNGGGGST